MPTEPTTSFTMALDPRTRDEIETIRDLLGAKTKSEAIRRMSHAFLKVMKADRSQPDTVTVLDHEGRRTEIVV